MVDFSSIRGTFLDLNFEANPHFSWSLLLFLDRPFNFRSTHSNPSLPKKIKPTLLSIALYSFCRATPTFYQSTPTPSLLSKLKSATPTYTPNSHLYSLTNFITTLKIYNPRIKILQSIFGSGVLFILEMGVIQKLKLVCKWFWKHPKNKIHVWFCDGIWLINKGFDRGEQKGINP